MGTPTSPTLKKRERLLHLLAEGHTVKHAAAEIGVHRGTVYDWRNANKDFKAAWDEALESGTQTMEQEARRRAVDGMDKPVFQGGRLVGTVREYSDTLLIFLLKGRRPDMYRERFE